MNKSELTDAIAKDAGISKADAAKAIKAFIDNVGKALSNGDNVQLVGFGTFKVTSRREREGRNPATGEKIMIKACKSPSFSAGQCLKDIVNK